MKVVGWLQLRSVLAPSGIEVPVALERRFPGIREIAPWAWGTEDFEPMDCYFFNGPQQWLDGARGRRLQICHAGHGSNSYALTADVVTDRLAVFVQVGFGGVYMDNGQQALAVNTRLSQASDLCDLTDAQPHWPAGATAMLAVSGMRSVTDFVVAGGHSAAMDVDRNGPIFARAATVISTMGGGSAHGGVDWSDPPRD